MNNTIKKEITEIISKKAFFHEEAHLYFTKKEDMDKFSKTFEKNPTWAIRMKSKYNAVMSITQLLGKAFPFSGGDLKITKAWFKKEAIFRGMSQIWIDSKIEDLNFIEVFLKESVDRSISEGNIGHENIQNFIEAYVKTNKTDSIKSENHYWKAFVSELINKDKSLGKFVKNIETVLPSEIPIIGELRNGFSYAGKWDLLIRTKDGKNILIDIKTGSNLMNEKEQKVGLQLNAYRELIKQSLDEEIDEMYCWELSYEIPYTKAKKALKSATARYTKAVKGETIDKILIEKEELEKEIKQMEDDKVTGKRTYFFKNHKFEMTDSFMSLAENIIEREKIYSDIRQEQKNKKEGEKNGNN